ncbi:Uncharacterized protein Adt_45069 [Abeliophyllum distichum]|uniref:Uncharacterized protein n=1 Tax=Abeliophyllum distichum TaxID=126358 RepID=A0ABD1PF31_9LAMI
MAHNGHEQLVVEVIRPLRDYIIPAVGVNFTCLVPPAIPANNYEIKPRTIQLVQQTVQFHDLVDEDPHEHVQTFYNGLNDENKKHVDSAGGSSLMDKTYDEALEIFKKMAVNSYQWYSDRSMPKHPVVYEVVALTSLSAQVVALAQKVIAISTSSVNIGSVFRDL